jgi:hypothetical protein
MRGRLRGGEVFFLSFFFFGGLLCGGEGDRKERCVYRLGNGGGASMDFTLGRWKEGRKEYTYTK